MLLVLGTCSVATAGSLTVLALELRSNQIRTEIITANLLLVCPLLLYYRPACRRLHNRLVGVTLLRR